MPILEDKPEAASPDDRQKEEDAGVNGNAKHESQTDVAEEGSEGNKGPAEDRQTEKMDKEMSQDDGKDGANGITRGEPKVAADDENEPVALSASSLNLIKMKDPNELMASPLDMLKQAAELGGPPFHISTASAVASVSMASPVTSSAAVGQLPPGIEGMGGLAGLMGAAGNPLDILKQVASGGAAAAANPFLLPAQLMALNPGLYAAQLAQLQAAQLILAKHQQDQASLLAASSVSSSLPSPGPFGLINPGAINPRKRSADDSEADPADSITDKSEDHFNGFANKHLRRMESTSPRQSINPLAKDFAPLDLSGSKSPPETGAADRSSPRVGVFSAAQTSAHPAPNPFLNPMMPAGLLNLFSQLRPPLGADFSAAGSPRKSPRSPSPTPPSAPRSFLGGQSPAIPSGLLSPATSGVNSAASWQAQWAAAAAAAVAANSKLHSANSSAGAAGDRLAPGSGAKPEDVFKCVWCRESYKSLEALTQHMREAKHHQPVMGAGFPAPGLGGHLSLAPSSSFSTSASMTAPSTQTSLMSSHSSAAGSSQSMSSSPSKASRDILREQMPLPRKLVRGQDVWIGRADEQTRDILKCMGCGQSFRSLELLTKHMQETQHYKKVISQDQLSAWKYNDGGAQHHHPSANQGMGSSGPKNHVNSVLTCKVCDKPFSSLKDLSDHMVKANHFGGIGPADMAKHNGSRGSPQVPPAAMIGAAAKDTRKKALPVKKLLELERARQEVAGNFSPGSAREIMETGKLLCERCEEKIPIDIFIPHIQQCVGRPRYLKHSMIPTAPTSSTVTAASATSPLATSLGLSTMTGHASSKANGKEEGSSGGSAGSSGSISILGSLEQLVKGNFHGNGGGGGPPAPKTTPPLGSGGGGPPRTPLYQPLPPVSPPDNKFNISNLFSTSVSGANLSKVTPSPPPLVAGVGAASSISSGSSRADSPPTAQPLKPTHHQVSRTASVSPISETRQSPFAVAGSDITQPSPTGSPSGDAAASQDLKASAAAKIDADDGKRPSSTASSSESGHDGEKTSADTDDLPAKKQSGEKVTQAGGNPLAALQMFCEDQKKTPISPRPSSAGKDSSAAGSTPTSASGGPPSLMSDPGAILAFSWACNQAVVAAAASAGSGSDPSSGASSSPATIKCPFCETPFISKGAYRHHLSKMHFTKENLGGGLLPGLTAGGASSATAAPGLHHHNNNNNNGSAGAGNLSQASGTPSPDAVNNAKDPEESLQSKYQKYSQLAKQLSCYDGTN